MIFKGRKPRPSKVGGEPAGPPQVSISGWFLYYLLCDAINPSAFQVYNFWSFCEIFFSSDTFHLPSEVIYNSIFSGLNISWSELVSFETPDGFPPTERERRGIGGWPFVECLTIRFPNWNLYWNFRNTHFGIIFLSWPRLDLSWPRLDLVLT